MTSASTGDALFRGMDAAAIDRQYNFRALVPEHTTHFARWQATSDAVAGRLPGRLDIAVGPHPRQRVDLFPAGGLPTGAGAPLLVFVHGGYWRSLSKEMFRFVAEPFVARGVAVALIGYGLCPDVTMGTLIGHAQCGLDWIAGNAAAVGADPKRLVVAGHSAGGHLAAMLASANPLTVAGAVSISGIYELEPLIHFEVNAQLHVDADSARAFSPIEAVPAPGPAMVLALGARETDDMHRQQADYARAWAAAGNAITELTEPGADHFTVVDRFADPSSDLFAATMELLAG